MKTGNRCDLFSGLRLLGLPFDAEGPDMKKRTLGALILFLLFAAFTAYMVVHDGWMIAAKTWGATLAILAVLWVAVSLMASDE